LSERYFLVNIFAICLCLGCTNAIGATCISVAACATPGTCDWNSSSSWDCGAVPGDGDDVIIAAGHEIEVSNDVYSSQPDLFIVVNGSLKFSIVGQLRLSATSTITINTGGQVFADPALPAAKISFGNGPAEWNGNDGTLDGPWELSDGSSAPLPVELLSFSVSLYHNFVSIEWVTAIEINNDYFTIERSIIDQNWQVLGHVVGAGNSKQKITYQWTDERPVEGISYYRLKQTDFDGTYTYSHIISVFIPITGKATIDPNPTNDFILIKGPSKVGNLTVEIVNHLFQIIRADINISSEEVIVDTSTLPDGLYIITVKSGYVNIAQKRIVVNH